MSKSHSFEAINGPDKGKLVVCDPIVEYVGECVSGVLLLIQILSELDTRVTTPTSVPTTIGNKYECVQFINSFNYLSPFSKWRWLCRQTSAQDMKRL